MSDKDIEKQKTVSKKKYFKYLVFLHVNILLYSVVGVLCKVAANAAMVSGFISFEVIGVGASIFVVLAIYAYFYQKIIKVMDLTIAYANRSILTLWTLIWAVLLFDEAITLGNIIGSLIIVAGIWMVVQGMNSTTSVIIFVIGAFLTAISQTLLKVSANRKHDNQVKEYVNSLVMISYALMAFTLCMNIIGYQWIEYKYGSVINCLSYVFIMLLGFGFLKEKLTTKKVVGNVLIVIGIVVFSLF